jgi:hypothetical protein
MEAEASTWSRGYRLEEHTRRRHVPPAGASPGFGGGVEEGAVLGRAGAGERRGPERKGSEVVGESSNGSRQAKREGVEAKRR